MSMALSLADDWPVFRGSNKSELDVLPRRAKREKKKKREEEIKKKVLKD